MKVAPLGLVHCLLMQCPSCHSSTRTLETRTADRGAAVKRRRECKGCGTRFTTFERREPEPTWVVKRSGRRQGFDRAKLRAALIGATHKRDVDPRRLEPIVDRVEQELRGAGGELSATRIGEICLEELERIDRGSFLQFAGTLPDDLRNPRKDGRFEEADSVRVQEDAGRPIPREQLRGDR